MQYHASAVALMSKVSNFVCLSAYKSEIMKVGLLRCREEPPKLLQGTRFQERTFQIQDHKLLLLKDKKVLRAPWKPV